jgi:pSer/pThr/pTyr-binding forkhead associated (FHA) protein
MTYQLIPIDKGSSPPIPLHRPVLLIGRHPECDIRLDLPKISRRHCCLALAYDRVLIRDLGSHNGLRVNGRLVEEARLNAGDEVAIGPIIYRLEVETAKPASPISAATRPAPGSSPEKHATGTSRSTAPLPVSQDWEVDLIPIDDF